MIKSFLSVFISIVCSTIVHAQSIDQLIQKFNKHALREENTPWIRLKSVDFGFVKT